MSRLEVDRDEFLRGVIAELEDNNTRWPGLWTRLAALMRERDELEARLRAAEQERDAEICAFVLWWHTYSDAKNLAELTDAEIALQVDRFRRYVEAGVDKPA